MDRVADAAWRSRAAPFDGVTLFTAPMPTRLLVAAAARMVGLLGRTFRDVALQTAEDWLEHDGFVTEPEPASWPDLRAAVATTEALIEASPSDTYVRRAWLARNAFYFRWHYYDEGDSPLANDPPAGGDLDATADTDFIAEAMRELAVLGASATTEPANAFFQQRWNG